MSDLTREQLLAENAALKARLAASTTPVSPFITEVSGPAGTVPPPGKTMADHCSVALAQAAATVGLARDLLAKSARGGKSTPEEIIAQITGLKAVIISGVNSAGYGDKRTGVQPMLTELAANPWAVLEEELDDPSTACGWPASGQDQDDHAGRQRIVMGKDPRRHSLRGHIGAVHISDTDKRWRAILYEAGSIAQAITLRARDMPDDSSTHQCRFVMRPAIRYLPSDARVMMVLRNNSARQCRAR